MVIINFVHEEQMTLDNGFSTVLNIATAANVASTEFTINSHLALVVPG